MGHQRPHRVQQRAGPGGARPKPALPIRVDPLEFLFKLAAKDLLFGIEELELEEIAQPLRLLPEDLRRFVARHARGA